VFDSDGYYFMSDLTARSLARNLKQLREMRGWSQQQFAEFSGVPRPTIANLESGDGNPTLNVLLRIAAALGASLERLIGDTEVRLERVAVEELSTRQLGQSIARKLFSDASGNQIERFEVAPKSRATLGGSRQGSQRVVSVEHGRIEVRAEGEPVRLKTGDVLRVSGEVTVEVENPSARWATLVVVTLEHRII
jgi:transcriptional regulator with XRE-family HTH domain